MTVLITLTTAGTDSGPFNLYSNLDGYTSAFEVAVPKSALLAGYSSSLVPDFTTTIRVLSTGVCTNYIDILLAPLPTTTTTSSITSTSTSTSTSSTTTTTTTIVIYSHIDSGISTSSSGDACFDATISPIVLYSECELIEPGCFIYTDTIGTRLEGYEYIFVQCCGNFDINPITGEVVAESAIQC